MIHKGRISTGGLLGSSDRSLLDYFEVANGPDGIANIIFADNGSSATHAEFTRQTSGPLVRTNPVTRTCLPTSIIPVGVVSRQTHGTQGDYDIPMPLTGPSGVECRNPNAAGEYKILVTFANPVTVSGNSVTGTGTISNMSVNGAVVTITLTGVTTPQKLTINLTGVNDGNSTGRCEHPGRLLCGRHEQRPDRQLGRFAADAQSLRFAHRREHLPLRCESRRRGQQRRRLHRALTYRRHRCALTSLPA